ncbi:MAG: TIGR02281 family clan AA aspartic protease [Gammaproteobacteria bacterium]|nr:TIGR02281 family clan AA aspartic protease [Gammaproteobacteria bacterium]
MACSATGKYLVSLALLLASPTLFAVNSVVVLGLFKHKAIVVIDGKQQALSVGETSPEGVRLISASSNEAVLEIDGQQKTYPLGSEVHTRLGAPPHTSVTLFRSPQGMFATVGTINGLTVNFLVDTGSSLVAMNSAEAKRLGINYRLDGKPTTAATASGLAPAYQVKLTKVKVGNIELREVDGMVIEGLSPTEVLLGMSFLTRLEMQNSGQTMLLKQKH